MAVSVDQLRMQHKLACDKVVQRLEMKSSRGEGPNRVLLKIMKHFDSSDGGLYLSADGFVMAMERIGTKLTPADLDLLLTVYSVDGAGFDGRRFADDLFGEGGAASTTVVESGIPGGMFSVDQAPPSSSRGRLSANTPSMPGGPLMQAPDSSQRQMSAPPTKRQSNTSSVQGGIFGQAPVGFEAPRQPSRTNKSSIPGGIFGH